LWQRGRHLASSRGRERRRFIKPEQWTVVERDKMLEQKLNRKRITASTTLCGTFYYLNKNSVGQTA
jgi:hypothetical protein